MNSIEIANYLEKIRIRKNISQDDYVSGIVSVRQYQRYKSGDSIISSDKIDMFGEKLGVTSKKLLTDMLNEKNRQYSNINDFYNSVVNNDFRRAVVLKEQLDQEIMISDDAKLYYNYSKIIYKHYSRRLAINDVISELSELIDYPNILKNRYFTDIEMLILSFFLNIFTGEKQEKLLKRLDEILKVEGSIISRDGNHNIYTLVLMRKAKIYGIKKDYEKVIYYSDLGIRKGIEFKRYYLWDYFYYYKALSYYALGNKSEFNKAIFNCFNVLYMENNQAKIEKFTNLIERDFNIDFKNYVENIIREM